MKEILTLEKELLSKELFLNFKEITNVDIKENISFTHEELVEVLQEIIEILSNNTFDKYYRLESKKDILIFLFIFYWSKFQNKVKEFVDLLLVVSILSTLFLSKVSTTNLNILRVILDDVEEVQKYKYSVLKYVESNDLRGLLYWTCQNLINISFDNLEKYQISYEYAPPKITSTWIEQYRNDKEPIEFWIYDSFVGKGLFLVLYSPKCRYAKCAGCNLPTLSSSTGLTTQEDIYKQADFVLDNSVSKSEKKTIKEVILSNNGNMFDTKTMPILSLLHIVNTCINKLPNLKKLTFESRLEYLKEYPLDSLIQTVELHNKDIQLEIAVGFEIFDENYRNTYYKKNLSFKMIEESMLLFSKFNIAVKFYLMFKSIPGLSLEDSITDVNNAAQYFSNLSKKYNIKINMHISPTYVATGTALEEEYKNGNYDPPSIFDIKKLYETLNIYENISYYISMNDEGLSATTLEDNYSEFLELKHTIENFNISQKKS